MSRSFSAVPLRPACLVSVACCYPAMLRGVVYRVFWLSLSFLCSVFLLLTLVVHIRAYTTKLWDCAVQRGPGSQFFCVQPTQYRISAGFCVCTFCFHSFPPALSLKRSPSEELTSGAVCVPPHLCEVQIGQESTCPQHVRPVAFDL